MTKRDPVTFYKQYTFELRTRVSPKNDRVIRKAVRAAARHCWATAVLGSDDNPSISVFTDDYFNGFLQLPTILPLKNRKVKRK